MDERHWMTALEMQFAALANARLSVGSAAELKPIVGMTDLNAAKLLPTSIPYSWSKETTAAVWLASQSIPMDAEFSPDMLPDDVSACWWWFEWPLPIRMRDTAAAGIHGIDSTHISALLIAKEIFEGREVLVVIDVRRTDYGPATTGFFAVPVGSKLSQLVGSQSLSFFKNDVGQVEPSSQRVLLLSRFIMAAGAWLKQRVVSVSSGHIERHRRKQIGREYKTVPPRDVQVVQLRRYESGSKDGETHSQEWSCRWIVNGHWRNQPYKDGRRLIYIMPYVKGPEDLPLRVPTHTVYAVNR